MPRYASRENTGLRPFNRKRHAPPGAVADGGEAPRAAVLAEGVEERHGDAGAGGPDGMAQRDGPAMHVQLVVRHVQLAVEKDVVDGEGFVVLEEVVVVERRVG